MKTLSATQQFSRQKLREWQKYRGWKLRILEELEHSGGMTTREISTRIGYQARQTTKRLCEMRSRDMVEKIENWGWKITATGIYLLSINYTPTIHQQHSNNAPTMLQQEKEIPAPPCFNLRLCHIRQICKDPRYTMKNASLCNGVANCIWYGSRLPQSPKEKKELV